MFDDAHVVRMDEPPTSRAAGVARAASRTSARSAHRSSSHQASCPRIPRRWCPRSPARHPRSGALRPPKRPLGAQHRDQEGSAEQRAQATTGRASCRAASASASAITVANRTATTSRHTSALVDDGARVCRVQETDQGELHHEVPTSKSPIHDARRRRPVLRSASLVDRPFALRPPAGIGDTQLCRRRPGGLVLEEHRLPGPGHAELAQQRADTPPRRGPG